MSPIAAFAPRLRQSEWFSHESAAVLWGVPLPSVARTAADFRTAAEMRSAGGVAAVLNESVGRSVDVTISDPGAPSRAKGAHGYRTEPVNARVVRRYGFPCSDAAATWLSLASRLSLADLVVAGDHFVLDPEVLDPSDPRPYVTFNELQQRTECFHGVGKPRASRALQLLRQGAESRPETLLRLLIRDARLPEPEVNPVIVDSNGRRIGRADLVFRDFRVIVEYDGDQHRTDKVQYRKDVIRWQRFMRNDWDVLRFHDDELSHRSDLTQLEIAEALARGGCARGAQVAQKLLRAAL
ncbi:hypothetical protein GCM10011399_03200 [Subtercola lobariae]|uniref:DUF559 domain-containing protein n=1 Tax=Subtercola lobariae TaxID=1588641 RepID=A0A917AZF3_9MICO|nr:hypothetical protein GCM10011399_03200 [Subtercola lobariae]